MAGAFLRLRLSLELRALPAFPIWHCVTVLHGWPTTPPGLRVRVAVARHTTSLAKRLDLLTIDGGLN